jgi:hypothetical protein
MVERNMQVRAEPTLWRADVISRSREVPGDDGLLLRQRVNGVRQLDLTVNSMGCLL